MVTDVTILILYPPRPTCSQDIRFDERPYEPHVNSSSDTTYRNSGNEEPPDKSHRSLQIFHTTNVDKKVIIGKTALTLLVLVQAQIKIILCDSLTALQQQELRQQQPLILFHN